MRRITLLNIAVLTAISITSYAQTTRTTPVEIKNSVSINQSGNTVNAQQSGTWSVGITGTPSVNISNTPGVTITNTPNVNLAASPTVLIDDKYNCVRAFTQSSAIKLWDTNQFVGSNSYLWSRDINCRGYKEARIIIKLGPYNNDLTKVFVNVYMCTPDGVKSLLGKTAFSSPAIKSQTQGDLQYDADSCIFTAPIMSDTMAIKIQNNDASQLPIYSPHTWVYLVN